MSTSMFEVVRRPALVAYVEVLYCMCGAQVCRHCGARMSTYCDNRKTHCPSCGCPASLPLNVGEPPA